MQGQAHGQGGRAQNRQDRGGLNAQLLQHGHAADHQHRIARQGGRKASQGLITGPVALKLVKQAAHKPCDPTRRPEGQDQNQAGHRKPNSEIPGRASKAVHNVSISRKRLDLGQARTLGQVCQS